MSRYFGIAFPFSRGVQSFPAQATDAALIKQSIIQILLTKKGERQMRPDFGTNVLDLLFENNNDILAELVRIEVTTALGRYEPRAIIQDVITTRTDSTLQLDIIFVEASTQQQQQLQLQFPITK